MSYETIIWEQSGAVGRLTLNGTDPEDFLYALKDARVGALD